jgi:hypothetical protein
VPVWDFEPACQVIVQQELGKWKSRRYQDDETFFRRVADELDSMGMSRVAVDAVVGATAPEKSLDTIFTEVLDLTIGAYRSHANWDDVDVSLDVTYKQRLPFPDVGLYGDLAFTASIPARRRGSPVRVKLEGSPSRIGPPSWASVPYVLCHELVCHAGQAAPHRSTDPFTEGWMDVVAVQLHDKWIAEVFPWNPRLARDAAHHLSRTLRSLGPHLEPPHDVTRAARLKGAAAAADVSMLLSPFAVDLGLDPGTTFEKLSLQVNRVPANRTEHLRFVEDAYTAVRMPNVDPVGRSRLAAALRGWLAGSLSATDILFFSRRTI